MNGFYYAVGTLRDYLKANGFINTVSTGDIYDVDLAKQTIYPYVHIIVNNATPKENNLSCHFIHPSSVYEKIQLQLYTAKLRLRTPSNI